MAAFPDICDVDSRLAVGIDQCSGCGARVSLAPPTPALSARTWLCTKCGSVYFARRREGAENEKNHQNTRSVSYCDILLAINVHLQPSCTKVRRSDVERLVQCMGARKFGGAEIRKEKRYPVAAPVTIVPLGPDFRVSGKPARAMTTNVSSGGAALIHANPIFEPYVALDFTAAGVKLSPAILQVTRVRQLSMAHEVAGRLVCRILNDD